MHFVLNGRSQNLSNSEVRNLERAIVHEKYVIWLNILMHNVELMGILQPLEYLTEAAKNVGFWHELMLVLPKFNLAGEVTN